METPCLPYGFLTGTNGKWVKFNFTQLFVLFFIYEL